jgi:cytochrome c oxidase subunit 4
MSENKEHAHHIVGPGTYIVVLLLLIVGTAATVAASFVDLGFWNPVIALAIATSKMLLVVLFFMHVWYSSKLTKLTIFAGVFMFLTLVGMTLADYMTRAWGSGNNREQGKGCPWAALFVGCPGNLNL